MMLQTAQALLDSLSAEARTKLQFPFGDEERFNWFYTPVLRQGLTLKEMTIEQRRVVHALLRTALSSTGYLKATTIMQLDEVLQVMEPDNPERDPERYYLMIFGMPSDTSPWGWRIEGHHLSLNFTVVANDLVTVTPAFWGANPAEVRIGPHCGLRTLSTEEELARDLLGMLDDQQQARAIINVTAPADLITGNQRIARLATLEGLATGKMTAKQCDALLRIISEYTNNLDQQQVEAQLKRIHDVGIEQLHFAWAGGRLRGEPHYYRIHGPTLLIEYDNTQNEANHIHTVWRDLEYDWGGDVLAQHYAESEHHHTRS
ncbi:MAG: DUF3500 domain-containing protein [Herpetosiphonaceae bacterium]|nr:DUF3500 domain-containing protein [Herpetosiphonaceae bacterium]